MKKVCVITGGGSGIGFAAAKYMKKDKVLVLAGRKKTKLETAVQELKSCGYEAYWKTCDTSEREQVSELAEFAQSYGTICTVIHSAGVSPSMEDPEKILRINALGTVYVNQEFSRRMEKGGVIVDVASNSAYALPESLIDKELYKSVEQEELFLMGMLQKSMITQNTYRQSGIAYSLSKNFAVWYAKKCAFAYGKKGIRVVSLSPGLIETEMGKMEMQEGSGLLEFTAEGRMGKPDEVGFAIAFLADERNGYLTGVDILCDGGSISGREFKTEDGNIK